MIKLEIVLDEEAIRDIFESVEIKFSKAKLKQLKEMVAHADLDVKETLEQVLAEVLEEMITDEWER